MLLAQKLRASSREYSLPGAPIIVTAYPQTLTSNAVTFNPPISDGGATITQYQVISTPGSFTGTLNGSAGGTISIAAVTGVTYTYQIRAINSVGWGPYSTESTSVTTLQIPVNTALPTISGTMMYNQTITCTTGTWYGVPDTPNITYTYQWIRGASTTIVGATSSTYVLTASDVGSTIKCTVTATNTSGTASATSNSTATIVAAPASAPTITSASATNAVTASVTFTTSADNGGSTITQYTVFSNPGNVTGFIAGAVGGTVTISGLSPQTAYTFTVAATNSQGIGIYSAPSATVTTPAYTQTPTFEYIVVGGGGGAGSGTAAGGGGGGGYLIGTATLGSGRTLTLTAGQGGSFNTNGTNSTITATGLTTLTAFGGGKGAIDGSSAGSGGSGGGGCGANIANNTGGASLSGQGNAGSGGNNSLTVASGGGGGGKGGVGGVGNSTKAGNGGAGITPPWGPGYYSCYGGGGSHQNGTFASQGYQPPSFTGLGGDLSGSGGGGGAFGQPGASGRISIRYPIQYAPATSVSGLINTSTDANYRYYTIVLSTGNSTISGNITI